jgi:hypothetical protein
LHKIWGESINFTKETVMDEIHILPTKNTPECIFDPEGIIKITGRGLFGNKTAVTEQIMNCIDTYLLKPAETTYVIIRFEYLNSFSTTIVVSILRKLSQVILQSKKLIIQWYYEEDDEDILERGEYISESFNIPIKFIMINDTINDK